LILNIRTPNIMQPGFFDLCYIERHRTLTNPLIG